MEKLLLWKLSESEPIKLLSNWLWTWQYADAMFYMPSKKKKAEFVANVVV